ncbi:MAG: four-carbon acid sugar kinase family protein [Burkholderiaceae bacterium]|nr:four-carbon acid sugar kinase family protein [Burkholderiaceae bacterium]
MPALLGCIADDLTGGTDLSGILVNNGMRTVQMIGVPDGPWPENADAVVVALKSRTIPVDDAVTDSLAALRWLQAAGCLQYYFKYCSTFDSTPRGNIGPVAEALMDALGTEFTIACSAFPATRRTIYQGYLFVNGVLLNESGMQHHPLTPMKDANLVRVLQEQTKRKVGLVDHGAVGRGSVAIVEQFTRLKREGCRLAIVDAISDSDLTEIGTAAADLTLVTGGSGLAQGLPQNFRRRGLLNASSAAEETAAPGGFQAVIAGSCSAATRNQVEVMRARHPAFRVDPLALANGEDVAGAAAEWAAARIGTEPVLIYATATPEQVQSTQATLGVEKSAALVERALAAIAERLVALGVSQLIVAGGETSGAVLHALGVKRLTIGREIDPGVPWTMTTLEKPECRPLALALKSGNFGNPDFFLKAWAKLTPKA